MSDEVLRLLATLADVCALVLQLADIGQDVSVVFAVGAGDSVYGGILLPPLLEQSLWRITSIWGSTVLFCVFIVADVHPGTHTY